ncbi:MAG: transketolase C-terminal domain-containing protein [Candidatus Omnitrophica bacterium]|nr:transketolase C-terminal domain-containing protein [Candidatus Omnitrophota bacterium]
MTNLRNDFSKVIHQIGLKDPNLVVLVGDISHYRLQGFAKDCPGRYYNIGICEPTIVNMAAGLSKVGFYPVVHTIAPFIVERSFEQIKIDFCYQKLGGNIITVGSAFDYAYLGCTHHCYNDFALLSTLPNIELVYPASYEEFDLLFQQTYNNKFLTYFRASMYGHELSFKSDDIKIGKAVQVQEGKDLTLVAVGTQLQSAKKASDALKAQGINVDLIYIHTVKPLDSQMIKKSIEKTKKCLVVEEHGIYGGVYDAVLRLSLGIDGLRCFSISIPNDFIRDYGTYQDFCKKLGLCEEGILKKIKEEVLA